MRFISSVTIAMVGLSAGFALAGEGQGDPFLFRAPPVVTWVQGHATLAAKSQGQVPLRIGATGYSVDASSALAVPSGAEGSVESANSLPPGFQNGTIAFASSKIMLAFQQEQKARAAAARAMAQAIVNSGGLVPTPGHILSASAK